MWAARGSCPASSARVGIAPAPSRLDRKHDIDVEPRVIVNNPAQKRAPPAYLTAYPAYPALF